MRKVVLVLIAVVALMSACSSIDCSMNNIVMSKYAFTDSEGDTLVKLQKYNLTVISQRVSDSGDTVLLNKIQDVSDFSLPVSYLQDVDQLHFQFEDTVTKIVTVDTVSIKKTNEPVFEGVDCAIRYHHNVLSASSTTNVIDSIVVKNKYISNDLTKVHFNLYLHSFK